MKLHTLHQAAELMDVQYAVLYQLVRRGHVPYKRQQGPKKYITQQTVDDWIAGKYNARYAFYRERDVQCALIKKLPSDITAIKIHRQDWPDYLFVLPKGRIAWIEFKKPGEKPRPGQLSVLKLLISMGHNAAWFDNFESAQAYIMLIYSRED